jgi:hypothetical protein
MTKTRHSIQILGNGDDLLNPGCSCGGKTCDPSLTISKAVEDLRSYINSKGYLEVDISIAEPQGNGCPEKLKELARSHSDLLPLVLVDGKVSFYGGFQKEVIEKLLSKLCS